MAMEAIQTDRVVSPKMEMTEMMNRTHIRWVSFWLGLATALMAYEAHSEEITCAETKLPLGSNEELLAMLPKRAAVCVREGKPAQAVVLMTRLIESRPGDAAAYLNRGSAHAALGEVALALSDYTTAIHLKPDLVEAWYNRGTTYVRLRRSPSLSSYRHGS